MDTNIIVILIVVVAGFLVVGFLLWQKIDQILRHDKDDKSLLMLQNQISEVNKTVDTKLGESTRILQQQFGQSATLIRDVTERLTKLDETNRQVVNFADQLQKLQDILKNPKQRGVVGEYYLETVLKNVMPPGSYQMQYKFSDGLIVDAVVFVKDKIIPIDAKFSLENYNRISEESNQEAKQRLEKVFVGDLKMRIQETAQYIRPAENTMDFAFMFIPHEAIYYDLLINKVGALQDENTENLIQRAASKYKVIIVSPTSFLAYLQTVLQGLRAMQIEESAKEIRKRVEDLGKHLNNYSAYFEKVGDNLGTTLNTYTKAAHEFKMIDKDVVKLVGSEMKIEPVQVDKPKIG